MLMDHNWEKLQLIQVHFRTFCSIEVWPDSVASRKVPNLRLEGAGAEYRVLSGSLGAQERVSPTSPVPAGLLIDCGDLV